MQSNQNEITKTESTSCVNYTSTKKNVHMYEEEHTANMLIKHTEGLIFEHKVYVSLVSCKQEIYTQRRS